VVGKKGAYAHVEEIEGKLKIVELRVCMRSPVGEHEAERVGTGMISRTQGQAVDHRMTRRGTQRAHVYAYSQAVSPALTDDETW